MTIALSHPLPGAPVTGGFGWRVIDGKDNFHTGTDIGAPSGTPICAAASGRVVTVGWDPPGYGHYVTLEHTDGTVTLYAHMRDRSPLGQGGTVKSGQTVGLVGSTGWSTGPHLHLEVRIKGRAVDPLLYITDEGEDDLTPEQDKMLRAIYATLTPGESGVKHQGDVHRNLTGVRADIAAVKKDTAELVDAITSGKAGVRHAGVLVGSLAKIQGQLDKLAKDA